MAVAPLFTFVVRDSTTIRDNILRVIRNGLIARGVSNPNVAPGSDWFIQAQAIADQLQVIEANAQIKADELMPDTAVEAALARICAIFRLTKQPAAGAVGSVILESSTSVTIPTDTELVDGSGLVFRVRTGGIYDDGDLISVYGVVDPDGEGEQSNHPEGDILRWVTTPAFANEKLVVATGGLVNGRNPEDDEAFRTRLLALLQNPPAAGNASHVVQMAQASWPGVQGAVVYCAVAGPGSYHVAAMAAPTASSKSRVVAPAMMSSTVEPYVKGQMPEHTEGTITSVADVNTDVAFGLALPEAPTASPPGSGGGWLDGTPWPAPDGLSTFRCTVSAVTSNTVFTVDATSAPTRNVSQICWLSPSDWKLYRALVVDVSGTSGAYVITLDQPFKDISVGSYIWPACQNAQAYVDAVLATYALMGPGEKTTNSSALVRGYRRPRPANSWPMALSGHLTNAITSAQKEVQSALFLHRTDGTTTVTGSGGTVVPQVPASLSDAPNIFVPRHIGFYRIT